MDYFSATTTIALSLLYAIIRTLHLQTPLTTSRLLYPVTAIVAFLVVSHFTYLLSFPLGSFPYDCHTKYVLCFAIVHNILWLIWSLSFKVRYPRIQFGSLELSYPKPYPPKDPLRHLSPNAGKPFYLVIGTTLAMSFELLDFAPFWRIVDAHSMWHMFTIPLAAGWWLFFVNDAIEMEGSMLSARGINTVGLDGDEKMPLSGEGTLPQSSLGEVRTPRNTTSPAFAQLAAMVPPPKGKARSPSPRIPGKSERED